MTMRKLTEITGEDTIDLLADLIEPMTNIATDPEVARGVITAGQGEKGEARRVAIIDYIKTQIPALIKTHKSDVMAILAAVAGVSVEEYAKKTNAMTLLADISAITSDKDLLAFFASAPETTPAEESSTSTTGAPIDEQTFAIF